jgi:hypothetical protein
MNPLRIKTLTSMIAKQMDGEEEITTPTNRHQRRAQKKRGK